MHNLFLALLIFATSSISDEIYLNGERFNSHATELYLSDLDFAVVANDISKFKNLKALTLYHVDNLSSLPQSLQPLHDLTSLSLRHCNLTELPAGIETLKRLKELNIDNNHFEEFPGQILALENLETLHLHANPLTSVPDALSNLVGLKVLSIPCSVTALPATFSKLALQILKFFNQGDCSYSDIKALPDDYLMPFRKLSWLIIYVNDKKMAQEEWRARRALLRDDNDVEIAGQKYHRFETKILKLKRGSLEGIAQLVNLEELTLRDYTMDQVPDVVMQLTNLKKLKLISNDLEFLPPDIKNLRHLTSLSLKNNSISQIPTEVSQLINLEFLDISFNSITEMPEELSQLVNLKKLILTTKKRCNSLVDFYDEYHVFYPFRDMANLEIAINGVVMAPEMWQRLRTALPKFKAFKDKGRKLKSIIQTDFEAMGVGGLDKEMRQILKEVVLPFTSSRTSANKYGIEAQRGVLLYGPPGTGKSLLAHQIAKMIDGAIVQFIDGPALVQKYVGETEEAIRQLFLEPQKNPEQIYVLVFDEIDGLFPQRKSESREHDNKAVTQFLALTGGAHSVKNVLVIGTTNRKDNLDPGFLRSGRFGCQIEVGLPSEEARQKILSIYLKDLKENKLLDDMDTVLWARALKGFSGADIEELVKKAKRLAFSRNSEEIEMELFVFEDGESSLVCHQDLLTALAEMENLSEEQCRERYPSLALTGNEISSFEQNAHDVNATTVQFALTQLRECLMANNPKALEVTEDFLLQNPDFANVLENTARMCKKRPITGETPKWKKRNLNNLSETSYK